MGWPKGVRLSEEHRQRIGATAIANLSLKRPRRTKAQREKDAVLDPGSLKPRVLGPRRQKKTRKPWRDMDPFERETARDMRRARKRMKEIKARGAAVKAKPVDVDRKAMEFSMKAHDTAAKMAPSPGQQRLEAMGIKALGTLPPPKPEPPVVPALRWLYRKLE